MRRALAISDKDVSKYITTDFLEEGYGYFGFHAGYDYGVSEWTAYAPEDVEVINVWTGRDKVDGGNIVEMKGKYTHRYLHMKSISVKVGDKIKEGAIVGVTGNTGNVGAHLHHDVRKNGTKWTDSLSNYYDWEKLIKEGSMPGIDVLRIIASEVEGFDMTKTHKGEYDKILKDAWGSKPTDDYVRHAWTVQKVHRGHLTAQVKARDAEIVKLKAQLAAEAKVLAPGKYLVN